MTVHKFDFETIHLKVLTDALDCLIEQNDIFDMMEDEKVQAKFKTDQDYWDQQERSEAEKLRDVFKLALQIDKIPL